MQGINFQESAEKREINVLRCTFAETRFLCCFHFMVWLTVPVCAQQGEQVQITLGCFPLCFVFGYSHEIIIKHTLPAAGKHCQSKHLFSCLAIYSCVYSLLSLSPFQNLMEINDVEPAVFKEMICFI